MSKKRIISLCLGLLVPVVSFSQGKAYNFLLGYTSGLVAPAPNTRAILHIDSLNALIIPESFKMKFMSTQANISDENGNLLFYTNGQWIADATHDTMQNGAGLNPGSLVNGSQYGMPFPNADLILPYPGSNSRYILFHQTGVVGLNYMSPEVFTTVIDMDSANGLGAVVSKNQIVFSDTLCQGMSACRHANGRDWWITVFKDSTDVVYKMLLTPQGVSSITSQHLNVPHHNYFNFQSCFSPDGTKFAYTYISGSFGSAYRDLRLLSFDRCTGNFSLDTVFQITSLNNEGYGISFSPNSKMLYATSFYYIYQINIDSIQSQSAFQVVAVNDTFYSPAPPFQTDFLLMYLAPNGKIFISSGNSVVDMHYINYPDSVGFSCDVKQHDLHLPCYSARAFVNHPNYYLGADTSSACDTLTYVRDLAHEFKFKLYPNPSQGFVTINYLLPQNQKGIFEVFDITGKRVFSYNLPQWSTLQSFNLAHLPNGIYSCLLKAGSQKVVYKLALIK